MNSQVRASQERARLVSLGEVLMYQLLGGIGEIRTPNLMLGQMLV
ncbi:hypothetical protein U703_02455 [Rhodobacter capsulatus YW1]|nr:hypothetical protein U703_02455 [Rhodobacter capsulatus YW1]